MLLPLWQKVFGEYMKSEYDFTDGERGKFFSKEAEFNLPIYLNKTNFAFIQRIAKRRKEDVSTIVNKLIFSEKKIAELFE